MANPHASRGMMTKLADQWLQFIQQTQLRFIRQNLPPQSGLV